MKFALSDLRLTSSAFADGGFIPSQYSGEGTNVSPPLSWTHVPANTQSFAVFCHDPAAPLVASGRYGFTHWVLYNIPGSATGLPEGVSDYTTGPNDAGRAGYTGPMPPPGHGPHQYFFWLLALDQDLHLETGLALGEFLERVEPHLIGMNRLVGLYQR
ncbi:MAG: YbhB/YbcL family Raf kinase inhibitor-like protein [Sulfobacillus acidophilus]|uniref:YbhB/YbcL family Raf kinase inhibitor-like protein n=1 Tax=Sulfobacillus acidophilus TaxID=53633 RepID=A0A2T2WLH2_9FIRM|nr:MAG: YbhB/YbcL family Raf kinase inhibitor-like protein [Sulfobacillus acidophilus]